VGSPRANAVDHYRSLSTVSFVHYDRKALLHVQTTDIDHYRLLQIVKFVVTRQSTAKLLQSIIIGCYRLSITVQQDCHALLQVLLRRCSCTFTAKERGAHIYRQNTVPAFKCFTIIIFFHIL